MRSWSRDGAVLGLVLLAVSPSAAHEFWIEPHAFRLSAGASFEADLRVGDGFPGEPFAFYPTHILRSEQVSENGAAVFRSRTGALPALRGAATEPGLMRLVYESSASVLEWEDAEKFRTYLEEEGLDQVLRRHRERGLPETGFVELFSRSVKALVQVGEETGEDVLTGLPLEFVLDANPYAIPSSAPLSARLYLEGEPFADSQVKLFQRTGGGAIETEILRTDANGVVPLPAEPGVYMVSSVQMRDPDAALATETGAVWHSIWTSLVFER